MSAIWGAIDLNGNPINEREKHILRDAFQKCIIDRYEEISSENVYMGCGIQYFVPEAREEKLPYERNTIFYTADVVLDNRKELCEKLGLSWQENKHIPDGELLYRVYERFGKSCLDDLLGLYTFVWYDKKAGKIEMIADVAGNRCVYYRMIDGIFYFSSLLEPLVQLLDKSKVNDRWLTDFLAMDHLIMVNETEETPIHDVYRIAPAQYISITKEQLDKEIYWNPFEKKLYQNLRTDEEYKKCFCELWSETVKDAMRTDAETAIMLSGGLDSTAVAAVAAPYLKEKGKTLYSYTSVPMQGYEYNKKGYDIDDESEDVRKTAEYYGNIDTEFIDLDGKTPWELMGEEFKTLEIPYKSIQNSLWLVESMRRAYKKNARIILSGSYGNTTISYTDLNVYMNTLYNKKKYRSLLKEVKAFSANMGFSSKYALQQITNVNHQKYEENIHIYRNSYVNRQMAEKLGTKQRLEDSSKELFANARNFDVYKRVMVNFHALRQIGELVTKHTLATGVLLRDPTKDKRIIEFCLSIPMEQFCKGGVDRRLVKEYLKEMMPQHVIRFDKQGKQSADLKYRFCINNWEKIRQEWIQTYQKYANSRLVDTVYAKRQLLEQPNCEAYTNFDLTRHMYTIQVLQYEAHMAGNYPLGCKENLEKERKKEQELITVIIPVYNTKQYLRECVESVCKQTYQNLEIILVDDGSNDGSGELCDELAKEDNRIFVIHKENEGVSKARNIALDKAKGEIITFVDSDDWIDEEMYAKLYELLVEQEADLACCAMRKVKGDKVADFSTNRVKVFYGMEMGATYLTGKEQCIITPAVWNRLYRREIIGDIRFPEIDKYEDCAINAHVLSKIRKGVFIDRAYYNYRTREESLSRVKIDNKAAENFIYAHQEQERLLVSQLHGSDRYRNRFNYFCLLLDTYCALRGRKETEKGAKALKKEMHRIRKEARIGIREEMNIGIKDKVQLLAATYLLESYFGINAVRKKMKF